MQVNGDQADKTRSNGSSNGKSGAPLLEAIKAKHEDNEDVEMNIDQDDFKLPYEPIEPVNNASDELQTPTGNGKTNFSFSAKQSMV